MNSLNNVTHYLFKNEFNIILLPKRKSLFCELQLQPITYNLYARDHVTEIPEMYRTGKCKVYLIIGHGGTEGQWRHISSFSLTSAIDGIGI
jgi:hypothetical protein